MSRRDRVTRKKSMQRGYGRKNVNPKLSAYQKEQKRNKLANQPPIMLKEQRDAPASSRKIASFIEEQARKRKEAHLAKYGNKNQNTNATGTTTEEKKETIHAAGVEKNLKNIVNNVQSLNQVVAAGTSLDESRVRLDVLAKKAKLRLKKKLRRRTKRQEIEEAQLSRLMAEHVKPDSKKGKKGSDNNNDMFHNNNSSASSEKAVPLTRAEKKKVQMQKLRQQEKEEARKKALLEKEKAERGEDDELENDDEDYEIGNGETDLPPADYQGHYNNQDDDSDDNENENENEDDDSDDDDIPPEVLAKAKKFMEKNGDGKPKQKAKTYNASSKKDFDDFDYVRYGDRVDAPPVLDVVPSFTLAAALERRTRKMQNEDDDGNNNQNEYKKNNKGSKNNNNNKKNSALDKFRVMDTAGQTSISELAQKMVHGRRTGSSDIFHLQQKQQNNNNNNNNNSFLSQTVSGAKLQGKEDFAALREKVMESYAKHHPKAFGKARTYTPL